jgi:DNA-binding transcriptional MerR regulator
MRLPETPHDRASLTRASELPSKLFFRIGEVASLVGVEPHVLRYWEREFRSIRPTKSAKGQRVYSRKDVENLLRVRDLLYRDGFTIAGAKKRLQRSAANGTTASAQASLFPSAASADATSADAAVDTTVEIGVEASAELEAHADDEGDDERDDEAESGARATADPMREKLAALRAEVEGFLHELESERAEI